MKEQIHQALKTIREGGVILYPTDTIWGLGCDPNNSEAIAKLDAVKKRLSGKNYIVLIDEEHRLYNYVKEIPEVCFDLTQFNEDPLTIVYPGGKNVAPEVLAEDGSIAIRICEMKETKYLLQQLKHGLLSTSANLSGTPSPENYSDVPQAIKDSVDFIFLPDLKIPKRKPSSIIKVDLDATIKIIRK